MIVHKGTRLLETARLRLRRFVPEDAHCMYQNWANDGRVTRFLTWAPHESEEMSAKLLEIWCGSYVSPDVYNWALEYEGEPIGNISVVRKKEEIGLAELGYCMGYAYWNKGLMTEAAEAVCRYLFDEVGFSVLRISHAAENPASGRVAQKCGFVFADEGEIPFARSENGMIRIRSYEKQKCNEAASF